MIQMQYKSEMEVCINGVRVFLRRFSFLPVGVGSRPEIETWRPDELELNRRARFPALAQIFKIMPDILLRVTYFNWVVKFLLSDSIKFTKTFFLSEDFPCLL